LDRDISHSTSDAISIGAAIAACFAVTSWFACATGLAALDRMRLIGVSSRDTLLSKIYHADFDADHFCPDGSEEAPGSELGGTKVVRGKMISFRLGRRS
jgi:hypothetical protein